MRKNLTVCIRNTHLRAARPKWFDGNDQSAQSVWGWLRCVEWLLFTSSGRQWLGLEVKMKNESQTIREGLARQISRLMSRPDRIIALPSEIEARKQKEPQEDDPRSTIRNVQGSSAGAGSGEFHVYRALRRKEQIRLKGIEASNREVY